MKFSPFSKTPAEANVNNDIDHVDNAALPKAIDKALEAGAAVQMRSELDDLPVTKSLWIFRRVASTCMLAAFASALEGYQISLTASIVANKGFIRQMSGGGTVLDPTHVAIWGGMLSTGQFVGVLFLQQWMDKLGRKRSMHLTWLFLAVSITVESVASTWVHWTVGKLIAGMGLGMVQAVYPVYISEQSPTQIRGFLTTAYMFWNVISHIFAPLPLQQLQDSDPYNFKIPIYTQWAMIAGILAINIWVPESPWWLVQKGKYDQAEKVLVRNYKGVPGYEPKSQLSIIVATIERQRLAEKEDKHELREIFTHPIHRWRLLIAFWPKAMQQLVGQSLLNNYGTYFFQLAGNKDPFTVTVILAVCQLLGVLVCSFFSDRFGRRWFTIGTFSCSAIAAMAVGILGCFNYTTKELGSALVFFGCLSNFGVIGGAGIAYNYVAEIPTQRLRARTGAVALMGSFLLGIAFNYTVPLMLKVWAVRTGFFFGVIGTISCIVAFFILPEMARRTPAEIDEMFQDRIAPRKFRKHVTQVEIFYKEAEQNNMKGGVATETEKV